MKYTHIHGMEGKRDKILTRLHIQEKCLYCMQCTPNSGIDRGSVQCKVQYSVKYTINLSGGR